MSNNFNLEKVSIENIFQLFGDFHNAAVHHIPGIKEKSSVKSSEKTEGRILALLEDNAKMTISDLADALQLSTRAIEKQIDKLKTQHRLKRIGADKGSVWKTLR